ncbi:MAG: vanadium-dependent haloperoxidase [Bacteroidota bacterium]
MKKLDTSLLCLLVMAFLILQSCSKEEDILLDATNSLTTDLDESISAWEEVELEARTSNDISQLNTNILAQWTNTFLEVERYAAGMRPNGSARAMAYIYLASYETAAPAMRDHVSAAATLGGIDVEVPSELGSIDWEIALNESFSITLNHFLINVPVAIKAKIDVVHDQLDSYLSIGVPPSVVSDSKSWGALVANTVIEYSQTDRAAEEQMLEPQPRSYEPPTGDGFWTYSADPERALFPYWESVRTFVISPNQTSTVPPIQYSEERNSRYFRQMQEVYRANNSARENNDEMLWVAEFWSDDVEGLMFSPPARQFAIANQLISMYDMNLEEALVMYLKLGCSLNDAAVATWKYKYQYMVMRPNVYIKEFIDPDFQTNLFRLVYWPNPSFPGYPSGHSAFASAAAGVFIDFFGDRTNFTDRCHEGREEFRGEPRTYRKFSDMAWENAYSRVPLGVHVRMDCREGLRLGYEIADAINRIDLSRNAQRVKSNESLAVFE